MIAKVALAGSIAVAAALASGYAAMSLGSRASEHGETFGGLDYVRLPPFAVPLVKNGKLEGYLLSEWVFTIDTRVKDALSVPPEFVLREEAFRTIYGEVSVDFDDLDRTDLKALAESIRGAVNARLGSEAIEEVLVQKFDYVERGAVRDNSVRHDVRGSSVRHDVRGDGTAQQAEHH